MKEIALAGNANSGKTTLFNYLTVISALEIGQGSRSSVRQGI